MAATPAYRAAEYVQDSDQHMTTSLAIQDRKKSTTSGKTHAALSKSNMISMARSITKTSVPLKIKSVVKGKDHIMEWKVQELILQEKINASVVIDIFSL